MARRLPMSLPSLLRPATGLLAAVALAACTATAPPDASGGAADAPTVTTTAAVPAVAVPPSSSGTWIDLGSHQAPWLGGDSPAPRSGDGIATRVAGLQADDGRWLALIVTQHGPAMPSTCPGGQRFHTVSNAGDGCLRLRRNADFDRWLQDQHPVLERWVEDHGWQARPRAWVAHRVGAGQGTLEAHALVHPALIEPTTRGNTDFLAGGQPGLRWAQEFAAATRAAARSGPAGRLQVPPFPYAAPALPAAAQTAATRATASPAQAEQVLPAEPPEAARQTPRPPAARARQDRH